MKHMLSVALLAIALWVTIFGIVVAAAEDKTTTTVAAKKPETTTQPTVSGMYNGEPSAAPWNATSTAGPAPAAVIFTIFGLVAIAQVVYIVWFSKNKSLYPEGGLATVEADGATGEPNKSGAGIDMPAAKH